jgi:hypothetical protein
VIAACCHGQSERQRRREGLEWSGVGRDDAVGLGLPARAEDVLWVGRKVSRQEGRREEVAYFGNVLSA